MEAFTARNVAKYIARVAVHSQVAQFTEDVITDHTAYEEDDFVVEIASNVVGWGVSAKLKPITDGAVDKIADFIVAKRAAKAAKTVTE